MTTTIFPFRVISMCKKDSIRLCADLKDENRFTVRCKSAGWSFELLTCVLINFWKKCDLIKIKTKMNEKNRHD